MGREFLQKNPQLNPFRMMSNGFIRLMTSPLRKFPDFIIIGAAKSGTSSLYEYIVQHPGIEPLPNYKNRLPTEKEIYFFDENFSLGKFWYKSYFSYIFSKKQMGEANPNYLYHPLVPKRIHETIPNCKFIIILRNPVDRAYSDYQMKVKNKLENLVFEDAITQENSRIKGEFERIVEKEEFSFNFTAYSYLNRGKYIEQLERWFKIFPRNQFFILSMDELERDTNHILNEIFRFLNLKDYKVELLTRKNIGHYNLMNTETRKKLVKFFRPYNIQLYKLLGKKFEWDK